MAPVGSIVSHVEVDKEHFHGLDDPVTGIITLTFHANEQSADKKEIFGPLKLSVVLKGYAKLIVRENRTSHAYILFHERRQISSQSLNLFDGSFKGFDGQPQRFPFQIYFPPSANYMGNRVPLPPTFHTRFQVLAPRQFGKHQGQAWIDHSLVVVIDMPGIDVETSNAQDPTKVHYSQGGSLPHNDIATLDFERRLEVQSYQFLPEEQRPSSLLDKMKAVAKNTPKPMYVVEVTCAKIPEAVTVARSINFEVRVRPDVAGTSSSTIPETTFDGGKVELVATTKLYATNEKGVDSPKLEHSETIATLAVKEPKTSRPFEKANDYTQFITTEPLPVDLMSSFSIVKLERSYRIVIELRLTVAGQSQLIRKGLDVQLFTVDTAGEAEVGSSRLGPPLEAEHEELPAYETAVSSANGVDSLPPGVEVKT